MILNPITMSSILLLSGVSLISMLSSVDAAASIRSFAFDARVQYAPLLHSLPNHWFHTAIYNEWPPAKLRKTLPNYVSAALVSADDGGGAVLVGDDVDDEDVPLIGPPIHVQEGDVLSVALRNSLSTTGLSLHWHGFEMTNALEYDGVVGVTQCPISPNDRFVYEFEVEETPGTYWWHTHSGTLGIHAINAIHGPLIVHPKGEDTKLLVDRLNGVSVDGDGTAGLTAVAGASIANNPWYYDNERILFFKDGFVEPDAIHEARKMGGLFEAVSKDDSGHTVGTSPWDFGTCNGRMREIVPVSPGKTYKFRLINGGVHYGLRINIANLKMTVVAADSEPVEPVVVNEVFLHVAERFDVEVTVPDDWAVGESFWIRADTLESAYQGYQNGVRAILSVSDGTVTEMVDDPKDDIKSPLERSEDHVTMNCFERKTFDGAPYGGRCLQIDSLTQSRLSRKFRTYDSEERHLLEEPPEIHTIDSHWQPYPQHSHFIRFDDGPFYQHVNPMRSMLDSAFTADDLHPHTAVLDVPAYSTVVLVWRTTSLMDHPMHLHGLKMEILDIVIPSKQEDCTLSKCKLNSHYESHDDVRYLAEQIPPNQAVLKDTFILPAGGTVVVRIYTEGPNLWYSHCHLEMHHFDGMAFILNVGNYSSSSSERSLPDDMPSCNSPFLQTQKQQPSCDCYENPNTILDSYLTSDYKCSREHLCHHVHSRAANLERYQYSGGDEINSEYHISGWAISFIVVTVVCLTLAIMSKGLTACAGIGEARGQPPEAHPKELSPKPEGTRKDSMLTYQDGSVGSWSEDIPPNDDSSTKSDQSRTMSLVIRGVSAGEMADGAISEVQLPPSLDNIGDEAGMTNARRGTSCSNVSDFSEPALPPAEPEAAKSQPGTRPSRRISFLQDIMLEEKGSTAVVETAEPVNGKKRAAKIVTEGPSDTAQEIATQKRIDASSPFFSQLKHIIFIQYKIYRPLCMSILRVIEVCSLGILTGFLFYDVGNNNSYTGLSQRLSLFFFSTTLWTFTRMYPSVGFSNQWSLLCLVDFKNKRFGVGPVVLGRLIVVLGLESFWPIIYVFVCYPFASVFGSIKIVIMVGLFLLLNNLCYIALGSVLGVYTKRVPQGMIASTIFSQTSLVAAGFFTKLPPALDWIRYISPFYWSFRGILKSCFKWNSTVECFKGSSDVGANQCYLEYHPAIDQYKSRGINVAMYNDPSSNTVYVEYLSLVSLLLFMTSLIYLKAWLMNRNLARQSSNNASAPVEGRGRLARSRRDSITNVIESRFDSERQRKQDGSVARRLYRSMSMSISSRFKLSGSEEAVTANEERVGTNNPTGVAVDDSFREMVMKRLQSSNVLTWK